MKTQDLKKLAEHYSAEQITSCIQQQLAKGENGCEVVDEADEVITALSKAEVVRELMDEGRTFLMRSENLAGESGRCMGRKRGR